MLNLNQLVNSATGMANEEVCKILLEKDRKPVTDVPAVYFVRPTPETVRLIAADASRSLNELFHISFSSSIPRPLLEDPAPETSRSDSIHRISSLIDPSAGDRDFEAIVERIVLLLYLC